MEAGDIKHKWITLSDLLFPILDFFAFFGGEGNHVYVVTHKVILTLKKAKKEKSVNVKEKKKVRNLSLSVLSHLSKYDESASRVRS